MLSTQAIEQLYCSYNIEDKQHLIRDCVKLECGHGACKECVSSNEDKNYLKFVCNNNNIINALLANNL